MLTVKWLPQLRLTIRAVRTAHDAVVAERCAYVVYHSTAMQGSVQRAARQVDRKASELDRERKGRADVRGRLSFEPAAWMYAPAHGDRACCICCMLCADRYLRSWRDSPQARNRQGCAAQRSACARFERHSPIAIASAARQAKRPLAILLFYLPTYLPTHGPQCLPT